MGRRLMALTLFVSLALLLGARLGFPVQAAFEPKFVPSHLANHAVAGASNSSVMFVERTSVSSPTAPGFGCTAVALRSGWPTMPSG